MDGNPDERPDAQEWSHTGWRTTPAGKGVVFDCYLCGWILRRRALRPTDTRRTLTEEAEKLLTKHNDSRQRSYCPRKVR